MSSWQTRKLGAISEMCLGKMLDAEKNKGEFQPYLANINVRWGGFDFTNLNKMRFEKSEQDRYGLKYGDLVVCEGGEPGRCSIWKDQVPGMKIQKALHRVRVHGSYSNEFIYYRMLLAGRNGELGKHFIGSTIKHLTGIGLKQVEFSCPPFEEQQKIAAVLSTLDAKIDCNNRINAELEAMAKTLYDYWFVQFDFPDANGKPYKSSCCKMVYNATLKREIPDGWSDAVVADILDKSPASTKILNKDIHDSGAIPVIDQSQSYICGFTDEISSLISPKQPHVVFGDHTRAVKLVNFSYARGADGTQILASKDMRMPGYLMYQAVSDIDLPSYGYARHFKFLKESEIVIPDQAIAQKYQAVVTPWFEKKRVSIFENLELARLREWLLPLLMNGQVTVA